jgi:hypothetical protein
MAFGSGLSALIKLGAGLELEAGVSLETLAIGRPHNSFAEGYELETCGQLLLYRITTGAEVNVSASLADSISDPEHLLRTQDNEEGWRLCFNFISSLERYQVQSLERPITVGNPLIHPPETCWVVA